MIAPARTAAFQALRAIATAHADLPAALAHSRQQLTDERDRSLTAEIVTGTLRWQRSLDHLVAAFARRRLDQVDPDVLIILRLSLYQLLHLDRVPAAAVVDDAVNLARAARRTGATGFVNAVLRSTLRQHHRLPLPARPMDPADRAASLAYLGITHSHPQWLADRWLTRYGFAATERWVQFDNETPRLTLRANTLRVTREALAALLSAEGIETEPTRFAPHGLVVTAGNPLRSTRTSGRNDLFVVQDEASQLVGLAVAARAGERLLDLCASPGGKTTALAGEMNDSGLIIACDVRPRRVALLRDTVRASAARSIQVLHLDAAAPLPFRGTFDRVLVDAPCSGLGTIRRDPDIRWRRVPGDLATFAAQQLALLRRAAAVVAPGGRLVYATCSSEPEENDAVVAAFLQESPGFRMLDLRAGDSVIPSLCDADGMLRTTPFAHNLEAFFAAALQRHD